jgi:hypothetical protein
VHRGPFKNQSHRWSNFGRSGVRYLFHPFQRMTNHTYQPYLLEDISDRDSLMEELHELEEPQMMGEHEECLDSEIMDAQSCRSHHL